jgi:transcription initiation factor TFIIB
MPPSNFSFSKDENVCPECNSTKIIKDMYRGEITCRDCGLVIEENIVDNTPRGLPGLKSEESKRNVTSIMHHDKGLSTTIGRGNKDANGNTLSPGKISEINRLRLWDKRYNISSSRDRNLSFALTEIKKIVSLLELLPNVVQGAAFIYKKALEKNLITGRSIECVVRACVYMSCRRAMVPKCLDEFISSSDYLDKREISRTYRLLSRELGIPIPVIGPCEYLSRISSKLALPLNVTNKAKEILQDAIPKGLSSGRNPMSLCAAAIYIATRIENYPIKQKDIANASNVTDMTLRARYKEIVEKLKIDI